MHDVVAVCRADHLFGASKIACLREGDAGQAVIAYDPDGQTGPTSACIKDGWARCRLVRPITRRDWLLMAGARTADSGG